ncbi:MAG: hypothetical protein ACOVNV_07825, partial [Pirellulaceae bacterium]
SSVPDITKNGLHRRRPFFSSTRLFFWGTNDFTSYGRDGRAIREATPSQPIADGAQCKARPIFSLWLRASV